MTLKQLKEKGFSIWKRDGKFILYKPIENWYNLQGYYGEFKKINDKTFQFRKNKPTSNIDVLLSQIEEYNSKLFRPAVYYDTVMRSGATDIFLIQDELKKAGFERARDEYDYPGDSDGWVLKTKVFGSSFTFAVSIKQEWSTRYFNIFFSMSEGYFSPSYKVRCFGAESVLYMVNRMKSYVLEQTIKQLVVLYEKEIKSDSSKVSIDGESVVAIDGAFRLWIDNRTWDEIVEQDGNTYDTKKLKPIAYFKKLQKFMQCADMLGHQDNTGLIALN